MKDFIFFSETSNIICTSLFLPRKVECCLPLNTTHSAIMKSFFEGHQASFVSISCKVKRAGKCQKEAETRKIAVQDGVQVREIDPVFWKLA